MHVIGQKALLPRGKVQIAGGADVLTGVNHQHFYYILSG